MFIKRIVFDFRIHIGLIDKLRQCHGVQRKLITTSYAGTHRKLIRHIVVVVIIHLILLICEILLILIILEIHLKLLLIWVIQICICWNSDRVILKICICWHSHSDRVILKICIC